MSQTNLTEPAFVVSRDPDLKPGHDMSLTWGIMAFGGSSLLRKDMTRDMARLECAKLNAAWFAMHVREYPLYNKESNQQMLDAFLDQIADLEEQGTLSVPKEFIVQYDAFSLPHLGRSVFRGYPPLYAVMSHDIFPQPIKAGFWSRKQAYDFLDYRLSTKDTTED